jgi:hypothetical protein
MDESKGDENTRVEDHPEELVLPAGGPRSLFPPVGDLVFKRDRSMNGVVYSANIKDWFPNGKHPSNGTNGDKGPK